MLSRRSAVTRFSHESARGLLVSAQLQGTRNQQLTASAPDADWLSCTANAFQPGGLAASRCCATRSGQANRCGCCGAARPVCCGQQRLWLEKNDLMEPETRTAAGHRKPSLAGPTGVCERRSWSACPNRQFPLALEAQAWQRHSTLPRCRPLQIRECLTFTLPKPLTTALHLSTALT